MNHSQAEQQLCHLKSVVKLLFNILNLPPSPFQNRLRRAVIAPSSQKVWTFYAASKHNNNNNTHTHDTDSINFHKISYNIRVLNRWDNDRWWFHSNSFAPYEMVCIDIPHTFEIWVASCAEDCFMKNVDFLQSSLCHSPIRSLPPSVAHAASLHAPDYQIVKSSSLLLRYICTTDCNKNRGRTVWRPFCVYRSKILI